MTFPADTYSDAVDLSITASNQLHKILNGDSTTEITVEGGSKIPSVRKAYTDSLFFLSPQPWTVGEYETVYNQLRAFVEPTGITTWWFSKTATVSTPILMSTTPHEDSNWTLWNAIDNSVYETQKRLAAEAGFNMVGSFLLGATVTNTDDVVFYETDRKYYKWGGDLPKTILAGTNPHLSGGIGITAWIDSTSYLLKDEVDYNKNKAETDYQSGVLSFTTDTGTANAYICTYSPVITSRIEGQVLRFKVANTNTGASTFNDGVGVVPLVGGAHSALQGGELVAGGDAWVQWNSTVGTGSYVLLFCAGAPMQVAAGNKAQHAATVGQAQSLKPVLAVVSDNNLILTLPKQLLSFRSATASDGSVNTVNLTSDLTLTIPSGATLGTESGILSNLIPIVLYNNGSPVLGVVNLAGGFDLSEGLNISSTAISTSSSSAAVVYSSVSVSASPYRCCGLIQLTQSIAGTWASAPIVVVPAGSTLISSLASIGFGQSAQNMIGSRSFGTTYYNTTGRPLFVTVSLVNPNNSTPYLYIRGNSMGTIGGNSNTSAVQSPVSFVVPPGVSYKIIANGASLQSWMEVR